MAPIDAIKEANIFDKTLKVSAKDIGRLKSRYLEPINYSKDILFHSMLHGKTVVFNNYPLTENDTDGPDKTVATLKKLRDNLNQKERIYIRYGAKRTLKKVTIKEVIERWTRQRSKFGVTDLHFRDTAYFKKVDANAISYFNLLPSFADEVSFLEMLTLVISSKGIFSDSHSDDGDGSNHCILGKKLWFAWDKEEGALRGLQDCTHDYVYSQAKFSIEKFLSLKSSHWFIVSEGKTLFMPGNFTHKVITLEPYIGFGSFYLSFPNYINSLKRWILKYSTDVNEAFIQNLNKEFINYLEKNISNQSTKDKESIGFSHFVESFHKWKKGLSKEEQIRFKEKANLDEIEDCLKSIG